MQTEKEGLFSVVEGSAIVVIVAATLYFCLYRQIGHTGVRAGLVLFLALFFLVLSFAIPAKKRGQAQMQVQVQTRGDFMQGCWLWLGWIIYGIVFEMYIVDTAAVYATSFFQTLVVCSSLTKLAEKGGWRGVFVVACLVSMAIPTNGNTWPNSFGLFTGIRTLVFFFVHSFACQPEDKKSARPALRFIRANWVFYVSPAFLVFAAAEAFVLLKELLWLRRQENVKDARNPNSLDPILPVDFQAQNPEQAPLQFEQTQNDHLSFVQIPLLQPQPQPQAQGQIQTQPQTQTQAHPKPQAQTQTQKFPLRSNEINRNGNGNGSPQIHSYSSTSSTTSDPRNSTVARPPLLSSSSSHDKRQLTPEMIAEYEQSQLIKKTR